MGEESKGKLQQFNYMKTKEDEAELQNSQFEASSTITGVNIIKKDNNFNNLLNGLSEKLNTIQKFNLGNDSDNEYDYQNTNEHIQFINQDPKDV